MRPLPRSSFLALLFLGLALPGAAAPRFEVSGAVVSTEEDLEVRVEVRNTSKVPARPLTVIGELFGTTRQVRLEAGLGPGESGGVRLSFPLAAPRPGVFALPLLLEYPEGGAADAAGNPPLGSQRAYLLLALGGDAPPAVRLDPIPLRIEARGEMRVLVSSQDGAVHRVRLSAFTARGLRVEGPPVEVDVPAAGPITATVPLMRSGAPRGTSHGILLVAGVLEGPLERTSVATGTVEVLPDPAFLPGLRNALVVIATLLLVGAAVPEVRRHRRERARRGARPEAPGEVPPEPGE